MAALAVASGCPAEQTPEAPTPGTTQSSTDTTQGTDATSSSSSSSSSSTGPAVEPTACDALPDEESCNAVAGDGFQCAWIADVYPVELDGGTCSFGEPVGRCIVEIEFETGCVEDPYQDCGEGLQVPAGFVREVEGGSTLIFQGGFSGAACGDIPELWLSCEVEGDHPACACVCDPGLPE